MTQAYHFRSDSHRIKWNLTLTILPIADHLAMRSSTYSYEWMNEWMNNEFAILLNALEMRGMYTSEQFVLTDFCHPFNLFGA